MSIVDVEKVSLRIGQTQILRGVDLRLERGTICGLVGRNGSGKTMLMKCISGFIRPTAGRITVMGQELGREMDFPPSMGIILETPAFIPYYSGFRNLCLLAGLRRVAGPEEVRTAMEQVGLDPALRRPVGKYSLGMRQRLGIAQAIMEKPELLILDEPMNGLDNSGVEETRRLLLRLRGEGKTILLASHHQEDISRLCDQVFQMDGGVLTKVEEAVEPDG